MTIMNFDISVRRSEKGAVLVGYAPKLPYSKQSMAKILKKKYGVRREIPDVVRIVRWYLEQSFLRQLFEPIIQLQNKVVALQLGSGDTKEIINTAIYVMAIFGNNIFYYVYYDCNLDLPCS